jgi:hypothetical protein
VERTALQNLRSNEDIIIKPADKGSAVVVMDKSAYIQEAERFLRQFGLVDGTRNWTEIKTP